MVSKAAVRNAVILVSSLAGRATSEGYREEEAFGKPSAVAFPSVLPYNNADLVPLPLTCERR
jgi:hypothetical protein